MKVIWAYDEWSEEAREAAAEARRQNAAPKSSGPESAHKTKISMGELKKKLSGMTYAQLHKAYNDKNMDPAIKEHIGREMDRRPTSEGAKAFR